MSLVVETGEGLINSDAYCSVEQCNEYHYKMGNDAWPQPVSTQPDIPEEPNIPDTPEVPGDSQEPGQDGGEDTEPIVPTPPDSGSDTDTGSDNEIESLDESGDPSTDPDNGVTNPDPNQPGTDPDDPGTQPNDPVDPNEPPDDDSGNDDNESQIAEDPEILHKKEIAIRQATMYVDAKYSEYLNGYTKYSDQALQWPRIYANYYNGEPIPENYIPDVLIKATMEIALLVYQGIPLFTNVEQGPLLTSKTIVGAISKTWDVSTYGRQPSFGKINAILYKLFGPIPTSISSSSFAVTSIRRGV